MSSPFTIISHLVLELAIGICERASPCDLWYSCGICLPDLDNCGKPWGCSVYDPNKFHMPFQDVTVVIIFAVFFVDAVLWYKASSIHTTKRTLETQRMRR